MKLKYLRLFGLVEAVRSPLSHESGCDTRLQSTNWARSMYHVSAETFS